jgi:hypothetical protein
MEKKF